MYPTQQKCIKVNIVLLEIFCFSCYRELIHQPLHPPPSALYIKVLLCYNVHNKACIMVGGWYIKGLHNFKNPGHRCPWQVFINYSKQEKLYKFLCISCLIQSGPEASVCRQYQYTVFPHENVQLLPTL